MYLKSLTLTGETGLIREIPFHQGLNLIVDETPGANGLETGNNVGKTTVLMLVDFCLGSSGKQIYTDPENKRKEYKLIKDFLVKNDVMIKLLLTEDLARSDSREICIERNFLARRQKIQRIDGAEMTDDAFEEALTSILFPGHYGKKPTFRQIISHNIRHKDLSINNTLKTLDHYTSDVEYETLYLFLLGCDFEHGDTKQELRESIRIEDGFKRRLEENQTKSAYEAALAILDGEIEDLEARKSNFNLNEQFEADLDKLNKVKYQINRTSSEIAKIHIRCNLILEAKKELEAGVSTVDVKSLELIYKQAKAQVDNIQKTFSDLHQFHNRMVANKVTYITSDLPKLESDLQDRNARMKRLLNEENVLGSRIVQGESFEELEKVIGELNEKFRKKGEYEATIQRLTEVENNLTRLNAQLDEIDDTLFSDESERHIKAQADKFSRYFSAISQSLYGEKYALKVDPKINRKGQRLYEFSAFNTNFSSGKKQGEISCFDIAYTLFADQENISCMHFLLNDKKELMHDNQLLKIAELVSDKSIQFVASILKDKLPEELNQEKYFVVKLSQEDKLFRIEN